MSLFGCTNDSVTQDVCLNGDCFADFYIDTVNNYKNSIKL
jgi:hypothetical protein